jgi:oligopeptide/dipeptide ABC transporter ATP-binding protein
MDALADAGTSESSQKTGETVLTLKNVNLSFSDGGSELKALRNVSLELSTGEILAIVGESGSGKSVTGLSVLRLHGKNASLSGEILFADQNLVDLTDDQMRKYRGAGIAMIFQEPMTALNPVFTVGFQLAEVLALTGSLSKQEIQAQSIALLQKVGIPEPALRLENYPFQLSGGMRQRILIAMALAAKPQVLIADEPTTALDVTIQSQILRLLREINERDHMSMIFITHDLGIVAKLAHRVAVMYAGEVVESGQVSQIFEAPRHPYTQALLASIQPVPRGSRLFAIPGTPPPLTKLPPGCGFAPRCKHAVEACHITVPVRTEGGRMWRCILPG